MVRNLALIKYLLAQNGSDRKPEIQETLKTINFIWEQHIIKVREGIAALEVIRDKEESITQKERVNLLIENLEHLI